MKPCYDIKVNKKIIICVLFLGLLYYCYPTVSSLIQYFPELKSIFIYQTHLPESNKSINEFLNKDEFTTLDSNSITNWKVYTNDKLGFKIKYPAELNVIEDLANDNVRFSTEKGESGDGNLIESTYKDSTYSEITIYNSKSFNQDILIDARMRFSNPDEQQFSVVKINNLQYVENKPTVADVVGRGTTLIKYFYTKSGDNKTILVSYDVGVKSIQYWTVFNTMLITLELSK